MYTCADCNMLSCAVGEKEKMPQNCPMRQADMRKEILPEYEKAENHDFYIECSAIEAEGYCQWTRLRETVEFCQSMGYQKIGIAFCKGLQNEARLLNGQDTDFNIVIGLCVGHDSLFYQNSIAPVTTLVAKDRVLAHNPCGAIYCAQGYYKSKL